MTTLPAGAPASERDLLVACRAGNQSAISEIVRRHETALARTVARIVGRAAVAEEIVQEAFLLTFERIDRIDPERGLAPWLYRVALRLARRHARRLKNAEVPSDLPESAEPMFVEAAPDPEQVALAHERRLRLDRAILTLSPRLREVVVLHYVEGFSLKDVAGILRRPFAAIRMRAMRGRARLLEALEEAGT